VGSGAHLHEQPVGDVAVDALVCGDYGGVVGPADAAGDFRVAAGGEAPGEEGDEGSGEDDLLVAAAAEEVGLLDLEFGADDLHDALEADGAADIAGAAGAGAGLGEAERAADGEQSDFAGGLASDEAVEGLDACEGAAEIAEARGAI